MTHNDVSFFTHTNDAGVQETLVLLDPYIVALVYSMADRLTGLVNQALLGLELDDVAQETRIKFWQALCEKQIVYPKAYLRRIVLNTFNDWLRKHRYFSLSFDEYSELATGEVLFAPKESAADPLEVLEQQESYTELLEWTVQSIASMDRARRQQHVAICSMKERVEDLLEFTEALQRHSIDAAAFQWPADEGGEKLLKASLAPARRAMAKSLDVQLAEGKKTGVLNTPVFLSAENM